MVSSDSPFPGWEAVVLKFVHPVKVAVIEALLFIEKPLTAAQLAKLFSGNGGGFREPHVRYHLHQLVRVNVLEVITPGPFGDGNRNQKYFYFAGCDAHEMP